MGSNTASGRVLRKAEVRRPSSHAQRVLGSGLHPALIWGPRGSPPDSAPTTRCLAGSAACRAPASAARPGPRNPEPLRPAPRASRHQLLHGTGPNFPEPHLAAPRPRSREDSSGAANARSGRRRRRAGPGSGGEPQVASRGRLDSRAPAEPRPRDARTTRERGRPRPLPPRPPRAPAWTLPGSQAGREQQPGARRPRARRGRRGLGRQRPARLPRFRRSQELNIPPLCAAPMRKTVTATAPPTSRRGTAGPPSPHTRGRAGRGEGPWASLACARGAPSAPRPGTRRGPQAHLPCCRGRAVGVFPLASIFLTS